MAVSEGKKIFLVPQVVPLFLTVGLGLSISLLPEISKVKDNFLLGAIALTLFLSPSAAGVLVSLQVSELLLLS